MDNIIDLMRTREPNYCIELGARSARIDRIPIRGRSHMTSSPRGGEGVSK